MKKGWGCTTGGRHRWKEWLALYGRLHDNDHTSHKYSIMVVKEGNDGMVDVTVNDSRYERQGGRIDGVFSTHMNDSVIMMHPSES